MALQRSSSRSDVSHAHSGYLEKIGGLRKNWQRRWFRLSKDGGQLCYFDEKKHDKKLGTIQLWHKRRPVEVRRSSCACPKAHEVEIVCPDRTWRVCAPNDSACDVWLAKLIAASEGGGTALERKQKALEDELGEMTSEEFRASVLKSLQPEAPATKTEPEPEPEAEAEAEAEPEPESDAEREREPEPEPEPEAEPKAEPEPGQ
jgi:hypothetical protein